MHGQDTADRVRRYTERIGPGTDAKAAVGARTTYLYCHAPGRPLVEIAHLRTRDVTVSHLRDLLAGSGRAPP